MAPAQLLKLLNPSRINCFESCRYSLIVSIFGRLLYGSPEERGVFFNLGLTIVDSIAEIITFVNSIPVRSGSVMLPIGSFTLFDAGGRDQPDLGDPNFDLSSSEISEGGQVTQTINELLSGVAGSDTKSSFQSVFSNSINPAAKSSFAFPFLENPTSIFGLLLGKDVTLVTFDLKPLVLEFTYWQSFPIYLPLFAVLTGTTVLRE